MLCYRVAASCLQSPRDMCGGMRFDKSLSVAERSGLPKIDTLRIPWSHGALLEKQGRAAHSLGLAA